MSMPEAADAAPLDDEMLVMDVADTLRHGIDIPVAPVPSPADQVLIERLRALYLQQGIEAPEAVLSEGIAAMADRRFVYAPPRPSLATSVARLYIGRQKWGRPVLAVALALAIGLGGYFFGYLPYRDAEAEKARLELSQDLPAQIDDLYQAIFNETKVQTAADDAIAMRDRGKAAAQKCDRAGAERAVADLTALRDQLEAVYTLQIVDKDGVKLGFWTFPPNNSEATNYYIVVEAVDADGNVETLPVTSEDTGVTQDVVRWALRVPQAVYDAVVADKQTNGFVEHKVIGHKVDGFTDVDYLVPVLGGALTQW